LVVYLATLPIFIIFERFYLPQQLWLLFLFKICNLEACRLKRVLEKRVTMMRDTFERSGSGPQPPSSEKEYHSSHNKSPRMRGVHFNSGSQSGNNGGQHQSQPQSEETNDANTSAMLIDLQEKVEALSQILHKVSCL
jgi:hypothetical protein